MQDPMFGQVAAGGGGIGPVGPADDLIRAIHRVNQAVAAARAAGWSVTLDLKDQVASVLADLGNNKTPQSLSATITRKV